MVFKQVNTSAVGDPIQFFNSFIISQSRIVTLDRQLTNKF